MFFLILSIDIHHNSILFLFSSKMAIIKAYNINYPYLSLLVDICLKKNNLIKRKREIKNELNNRT